MDETMMPINIVIGDRNYRIRIDPKDEETVRKTLKTVNEKILEFKTNFAGQDMQDYVAMVLVWFATQLNNGNNEWQEEAIIKQLNHLEALLPNSQSPIPNP
jgi:cell division protein ZapA (FtsZ GTPase activity inhibitor)